MYYFHAICLHSLENDGGDEYFWLGFNFLFPGARSSDSDSEFRTACFSSSRASSYMSKNSIHWKGEKHWPQCITFLPKQHRYLAGKRIDYIAKFFSMFNIDIMTHHMTHTFG